MDLQKARDWADLLLKILSILAIMVAGVWAYYQHWVTDTAETNAQVTVSTEYLDYEDDSRLLLIHVKPKNIGKVAFEPGKQGFIVSVRRIPDKHPQGPMELDTFPEIYKTDIVKRFSDEYDLEPGVEYDEIVALVVPKHSMYAIKATLDLGDGTEVDHTAVARIE